MDKVKTFIKEHPKLAAVALLTGVFVIGLMMHFGQSEPLTANLNM